MESANEFEQIFFRLLAATGSKNDSEFARVAGITAQSVNGARKRGRVPSDWIQFVAEKFLVSSDWLFFGRGEPRLNGEKAIIKMQGARAGSLQAGRPIATPEITTIACDSSQIVMVPMVEARLSAGTGSFETSGDQERRYAFRLDFLRRKGIPSQMVLMRVAGDSMEPKIEDNDVVLIDQSQTAPIPGRLYAVGVEDLVYIKLVNAEPGKLVLTSYNQTYPPLEIDAREDLANGIRIIGRAVWVGRELK